MGGEELSLYCAFHVSVLKARPHSCHSPSLHEGCRASPKEDVALPPCHTGLARPFLHSCYGKGRWLRHRQGVGWRQSLVPSPERCCGFGERSWESLLGSCSPNCQCSAELKWVFYHVFVVVLFFCLFLLFYRAAWNPQDCFLAKALKVSGSVDISSAFVPITVSRIPVFMSSHKPRRLWTSGGLPRALY